MRTGALLTYIAALVVGLAAEARAQHQPMAERIEPVRLDSGAVSADRAAAGRAVIWSDVLHVPGARTLRLRFDALQLGAPFGDGRPTTLRITSLEDGAHQDLDAQAAAQWSNTSAYFNGDMLLLELIADPTAGPSRVSVDHAIVSASDPEAARTICGPDDDRLPSEDARIGRVIPNGCTAWIIDDANHTMLTAGHCTDTAFEVIEFNVPLSDDDGVRRHAHPNDQYVIDPQSVQSQNGGIGNDWSYFGCFANCNTGKTPFEAQGAFFELAAAPPPADKRTLRITGHGTVDEDMPPPWNRAQKTHTGAFVAQINTSLRYTVDTTGGNSGSPVFDETTGRAIGIHTHGGCSTGGGENIGTAINQFLLVDALNNPQGVCAPPGPTLVFTYSGGPPELVDPAGQVVQVTIEGATGGTLDDTSPTLHYDTGDGFDAIAMTEYELGAFQAALPALPCGSTVAYYISAKTIGGVTVTDPADAPAATHDALVAAQQRTAFFDNGETDAGWTVFNDPSLEAGAWQRGIPAGGGDRGDPRLDFDDPSHQCWLTGNVNGDSDVDGGPTRLISPTIDLSTFDDPHLSYAVWFYTDEPGGFDFDRVALEVSDDGGQSWTQVNSETTPTEWAERTVRLADHVDVNDAFRMRFSAIDEPSSSVVEAAIDVVHVYDIECDEPNPADVNDDGVVDVFDVLALLSAWGSCDHACPPNCLGDITGDCTVDVADLLELLAAWG